MPQATKLTAEVKNIDTPDERRTFEHGSLDVVNLTGATIGRAVFQPGWKWSTDIKPLVGTQSCQVAHTGYIISGRLGVRMDDGHEYDFGPGDAHVVAPGHDAWVVGDEPCIALDFAATGNALAGHVGSLGRLRLRALWNVPRQRVRRVRSEQGLRAQWKCELLHYRRI